MYEEQTDLLKRIKENKILIKFIARKTGETVSVVSARLFGYCTIDQDKRAAIVKAIDEILLERKAAAIEK